MTGLEILSSVFGWIGYFAWSISFYGQIYENYTRKSVSGLSFDFEVYNFTGFLAYTVYNIWGFCVPNVVQGTFHVEDIVFAIHALAATIITIGQIFYYYDKNDETQKVSNLCILITSLLYWGTFNIIFVENILGLYPTDLTKNHSHFNITIYLGFQKVFISFIKYIPQVKSNYLRKSTEGWSIFNILMDLTGGTFSLVQNLIDGIQIVKEDQNNGLNIAKFALSLCCIFFDIIFLFQHFYLYKSSYKDDSDKLIVNSNIADYAVENKN